MLPVIICVKNKNRNGNGCYSLYSKLTIAWHEVKSCRSYELTSRVDEASFVKIS